MAWLHTWAGLLLGWVLFFIFFTGTLSYLRFEIDAWMMPEKPAVAADVPQARAVRQAVDYLSAHAANTDEWLIFLPHRSTGGDTLLYWETEDPAVAGGHTHGDARLDPATGKPQDAKARDTGGGGRLYEMHFSLYYIPWNWAIRIVGICAMFMLVGIVSGIVVHKKIFADFFTLRHGKGQRSWLDWHNILGVTTLPFLLMITYSGLVLYTFTYMPAGPAILFGKQPEPFTEEVLGWAEPSHERASGSAALTSIDDILDEVVRRWGSEQMRYITVRRPGRSNAELIFTASGPDGVSFSRNTLTFAGATGALTHEGRSAPSTVARTSDILASLHVGYGASPLLRALYVLSGLAGTAMIGTGLILWSVKRRSRLEQSGRKHFGLAFVDRLNIGTIVGLPIAVAAYFWANRLIPLDLPHRRDWEVHAMFLTWAAMLIYPIWRPLHRAWIEMFALAGFAYGLIPILNALTTSRHLVASVPAGDWVMAGFDLTALVVGIVFAVIAWMVHRKSAENSMPTRSKSRTRLQSEAG